MKIDLKKIFLTPPMSLRERIILFVVLLISFLIFFQPLKFSSMHPAEAIVLASIPSLSVSWGWIVLLRALFYKSNYIEN